MLHPAPPQPTAAIRAGTGSPWPNRRTSGIAARCGSARIRVRRPRGGPFSSEEREEANQGAEDEREDRDDDQSEHEAEEAEAAARAQSPSVPADPPADPSRTEPDPVPHPPHRGGDSDPRGHEPAEGIPGQENERGTQSHRPPKPHGQRRQPQPHRYPRGQPQIRYPYGRPQPQPHGRQNPRIHMNSNSLSLTTVHRASRDKGDVGIPGAARGRFVRSALSRTFR